MAIDLDKALGTYANALTLRSERAGVLANNIANADTPGYKARDLNFHEVLKSRMGESSGSLELSQTRSGHSMSLLQPDAINGMQYRIAAQPSIDGNTVDAQVEKTEFSQNALQFQTAFTMLNSRINGIRTAIRGE